MGNNVFLHFVDPSIHGLLIPNGSDGKESACNTGDMGLISGSGRSPGEGIVFLPGKSHGQRNLSDYTPQGLRVGHN